MCLAGFGLWILIIFMAVWMLFPFYWAINSSFKSENQLQMMPATFAPRGTSAQQLDFYTRNYQSVLTNRAFLRGILNSAIVAISVTALSSPLARLPALPWASSAIAARRRRCTRSLP